MQDTDAMINDFVELTLNSIPNDDVLPLIELMINPSDCTVIHYQILKGAITLDQMSVVELKLLIQKYYIQDICFGTEFTDSDESANNITYRSFSVQHAIHEMEFFALFLNDATKLHNIYLHDGDYESDMHIGVLCSWLYIVRMLYHERESNISQQIRQLNIVNDDIVDIIMNYAHHNNGYLKFTNKSIDDKFFRLAMIYMTDYIFHLSVDQQNWKQFVIDNIWNKLTLEQIAMIRSDELMEYERYEIWCTLEHETNKVYKERSLQVFGIHSNPMKSMKTRPVLSENVEN